jgi:hypothetical protein
MPKLNDITETSMQRPVAPKLVEDDANYDVNLRPRGFDEYVGQEQVKENLKVAIAAARSATMSWIISCSMDRQDWARHRSPTYLAEMGVTSRLPRGRWWSAWRSGGAADESRGRRYSFY